MTDRLTLVYNFCVILVCKGMPSMPLKSGIDIDIDRFSCSCLIRYTAVTSFTAFFLGGGCGGGGGGGRGRIRPLQEQAIYALAVWYRGIKFIEIAGYNSRGGGGCNSACFHILFCLPSQRESAIDKAFSLPF